VNTVTMRRTTYCKSVIIKRTWFAFYRYVHVFKKCHDNGREL